MSTLRERKGKWQSIVRVIGHPILTKTFTSLHNRFVVKKNIPINIRRNFFIHHDILKLTSSHLHESVGIFL